MSRDKMFDRMHHYNLDKIDSIITVAILGDCATIYIPKKIRKLALQMLKDKGLSDTIKIKTI